VAGGGSVIGQLESGKKVFVWGGLPDEIVQIELIKDNTKYAVGIVKKVLQASDHRVKPFDKVGYLSTSPYQISNFAYENYLKSQLIIQAFALHKLNIVCQVKTDNKDYFYRNKYNYTFIDKSNKTYCSTTNFAITTRQSHAKIPVKSISLPNKNINQFAKQILYTINQNNIRHCHNLLVRSSADGTIIARLYIKSNNFNINCFNQFNNLEICEFDTFTNKIGKTLKTAKTLQLVDKLLNKQFIYSLDSFWQINQAVYEMTLNRIKQFVDSNDSVLDFYSGVGSIGLSVTNQTNQLTLVEIDQINNSYAKINADKNNAAAKIKTASVKTAANLIKQNSLLIVDPARTGLSKELTQQINKVLPKRIIYLSCNPVTQARDIKNIIANYKIVDNLAYNYFCKTPHIEHLIILDKLSIK
jgi:23S rRNA (uracil1939-C5)-methyltransferase